MFPGFSAVARTQDVWGAEGISGRVKFLLLAWAGMPKTSFRKNSDSPPYKQQPNISPLFWLLIRTGQIQLDIQNFALIRLS
jgi:hypothetical protein